MLKNNKSRAKKALVASLVLIFLMIAGMAFYLGDYYHADMEAVEAISAKSTVQMQTSENGNLIWEPDGAINGFIFYPGGKVEHTAYIPLMQSLASKGVLCVLVEMPFRLAVFDVDAAEEIQEQYPEIKSWYIGGHSLGGSMAASYISECEEIYKGLILLGSYSTADLSEMDIEVLSIYGSEDGVLNREKYVENKVHLPKQFEEIVIDGGCHAYFGTYGAQDGDGVPEITNEEQIEMTAEMIAEVILR